MKKVKSIIKIVILALIAFNMFSGIHKKINSLFLRESIYDFLMIEKNQKEVFRDAMALNHGSSKNCCVYFVSEVLRRNNYFVPEETANTTLLISFLEKKGWKKNYNLKKLKPGHIVFTTDNNGTKKGKPTHTYIFMGWVEEGSYDYAYICDNQAKDYGNQIYHIRNVKNREKVNGLTKDAFSFFMTIE
ncbi:hypothetical protein [Clostridium thermopalmarium]|uniref:Bacteriophage peptidoglycan hydrolase n=1 Tax=Clostridium thermopalmarium DSM 5974 TaxID=1121340 RepID=A0A2T0ARS2_9CLOT|nr:hypothetical protein [Clostridium thermopalmarium]PRR72101.1 hypothetical protein CPAL_15880 [Clostridium thermopalmarium DSM 5974]PVZ23753.1 hypothetical protein LX19_01464 [Clostridium thermopalmarium DSM 5974]